MSNQQRYGSDRLVASVNRDAPPPEAIINAALEILARDGYQRLTVRAIAEEAGVNHALISYYFGGKQKLLLAILERLESAKFARQWEMYDEPGVPLSRKWRQAVQFYRDDLDDGYVAILYEIRIAARHNPEIAAWFQSVVQRWYELLLRVAVDTLPPLGIRLPPEDVVDALITFWRGIDERVIAGGPEEEEQCFRTLEFIGDWLEERERACLGDVEQVKE